MASHITICPIPKPVSEDHVTQYTHLRLAALKANPEAFGSTFAAESAFSREQWCRRVDNPARTTFFATSAPSTIADASLERDALGSYRDNYEFKWIGTLSLLGPEMLCGVPFPPKLDRGAEIYMLTGMWVDPKFRKKGVGRQLIEHALQTVRDIDGGQNGEGKDRRERLLLLEVNDANFAAQRLYESQGFVVEPGGTKESRRWMTLNIN